MGALLFLKATSDCRFPSQYPSLLNWLWQKPGMGSSSKGAPSKGSSKSGFSDWVYLIISYDVDTVKAHKALADTTPKLLGRAITAYLLLDYSDRIKLHFKHQQLSNVTNIRTKKTHLHYMQGLVDVPTPVQPAFMRYLQDVAPVKSWLLLDYLGHEGCPRACLGLWFRTALSGGDMNWIGL
ncbi:hypothetical protein PSACC_01529 [Paramicrosporidium saccamoebae]|uniref:Uncharacterized protein n=1 Tax=Paramicrosporidium saccamoebae TaxID=1246581 RepID=A0A2H9TLR9_9FUNG|nr:hypothetical protein PSACC_01529 [Paramicrosporidium saccamoebae]